MILLMCLTSSGFMFCGYFVWYLHLYLLVIFYLLQKVHNVFMLRSQIHEYRHVMFITIEHIKNIGISKFENTLRLLVQVGNLFINFELKIST